MNNIASLRKLKGWSQTDLADIVGVKQPTVARIEGDDEGTTLRRYKAIAKALDVPLYAIFLDDASQEEMIIISTYRGLSQERKLGWAEMAQVVKAGGQLTDQ